MSLMLPHFQGLSVSQDDVLRANILAKTTSYWKLEEASGAALDSVGSNNLTANNNPVGGAGKVGNGRNFVGASSQSLSIADNASLRVQNTSFAISCWFNVTASTNSIQYLLAKTINANSFSIEFGIRLNATTVGILKSDGTTAITFQPFGVTFGVWNFLAAWYDVSNNTIYARLNGGTVFSIAGNTGFAGTGGFAIGKLGASASNPANGIIDEVIFAKGSIFTTAELDFIYNSGNGRAL